MGACGYVLSNQAVFFMTAALVAPAQLALGCIRTRRTARSSRPFCAGPGFDLRALLSDRRLLVFSACILLFQLANAAMLPLMGGILADRCGAWAASFIGACTVVPQLVVIATSPLVARAADWWGRRRLLLLCFVAVAVRGALFAVVREPGIVIAVQTLDGISAAVLGILVPLVVADIMADSGQFNLALGTVGTAVGIGAAMSTSLAGYAIDHFGGQFTFALLASIAACGWASFGSCCRRRILNQSERRPAARNRTDDYELRYEGQPWAAPIGCPAPAGSCGSRPRSGRAIMLIAVPPAHRLRSRRPRTGATGILASANNDYPMYPQFNPR
jgi:MFS family permease